MALAQVHTTNITACMIQGKLVALWRWTYGWRPPAVSRIDRFLLNAASIDLQKYSHIGEGKRTALITLTSFQVPAACKEFESPSPTGRSCWPAGSPLISRGIDRYLVVRYRPSSLGRARPDGTFVLLGSCHSQCAHCTLWVPYLKVVVGSTWNARNLPRICRCGACTT
jgi:hypothetical protein